MTHTVSATVIVTVDNAQEIEAINAWFRRWGTRIRCSDNLGCGCCIDMWDVQGPVEALDDLPPALRSGPAQSAAPSSG